MTLEQEIKDLESQRDAQLRAATYLYARTKRDLRRKLSPDRIVRKNIGVALAAAAVGAMLIAPGPHRAKAKSDSPNEEKPRGAPAWLAKLRGLLPAPFQKLAGLAVIHQPDTNGQQAEQKRKRTLLELLLAELMAVVVRQVNWTALLQHLMQRLSPAVPEKNFSEEPLVAVANVGTTPSDQVLDGKLKS